MEMVFYTLFISVIILFIISYQVEANHCSSKQNLSEHRANDGYLEEHKEISVQVNGFYREMIVFQPSRVVDIHFEIRYPTAICCPILFFTFHENNRHVQNGCFEGQSVLEKDTRYSRGFILLKPGVLNSGCTVKDSNILCISSTKLQSYKPRNWYFIIGYQCGKMTNLQADLFMSVHSTNNAVGEYLQEPVCQKYYKQTSFPNFVGHTLQSEATTMFNVFRAIFMDTHCHQHSEEFLCRIFFFEFRGTHVFPICKRSCEEILAGCWPVLSKYNIPLNCTYFPDDSENCFHKTVDCGSPKQLENGITVFLDTTLGSETQYSCTEGYLPIGSVSVSHCGYSGQWSSINISCIKKENDLLHKKLFYIEINVFHVVVMSATVLSILSTAFIFIRHQVELSLIYYIKIQRYFKKRWKPKLVKGEHKQYEAFVSYASSNDIDLFVMDKMTTNLETDKHVKLKLFLHHRDYMVGNLIISNILNGIQESKTAVILLNQDYIKQKWCISEFAHCHKQLIDDDNFKIIIVLMQPVETLQSIPRTIRAFLNTTTYISVEDPRFWTRLIKAIVN